GIRAFHVTGVQTCALPIYLLVGVRDPGAVAALGGVAHGADAVLQGAVGLLPAVREDDLERPALDDRSRAVDVGDVVEGELADEEDRKSVVEGKSGAPGDRW